MRVGSHHEQSAHAAERRVSANRGSRIRGCRDSVRVVRLALSALLLLSVVACRGGQTGRDTNGPDGLPKVIPYGVAQYDNPKPVSSLPPGVEATGGKLRGGGVAYGPPGDTMSPPALWIVKDGKVWKYTVDRAK